MTTQPWRETYEALLAHCRAHLEFLDAVIAAQEKTLAAGHHPAAVGIVHNDQCRAELRDAIAAAERFLASQSEVRMTSYYLVARRVVRVTQVVDTLSRLEDREALPAGPAGKDSFKDYDVSATLPLPRGTETADDDRAEMVRAAVTAALADRIGTIDLYDFRVDVVDGPLASVDAVVCVRGRLRRPALSVGYGSGVVTLRFDDNGEGREDFWLSVDIPPSALEAWCLAQQEAEKKAEG